MRPPLKPLGIKNLRKMVAEADVIALGTISSVTESKSLHGDLQTVVIRAAMRGAKILKGDVSLKTITIEESYQRFSSDDSREENITALIAGPSPWVGLYHKGDRMLVFLKPLGEKGVFQPLGSGDYDAYLGLLHITSGGVESDKYMLDETVSRYARNEESFLSLIERLL